MQAGEGDELYFANLVADRYRIPNALMERPVSVSAPPPPPPPPPRRFSPQNRCARPNRRCSIPGTSVSDLMEVAAGGAAEWIRRIGGRGAVSRWLCGPRQ